ncbi:hypothetical protein NDU88_010512 [Pleurodeles waltl]|uniref:Peptidase C2 calpain domain-containing protein n=1 Tax=Pleurodeles waltl TaxID=8319 RepID=A0AAV7RYG1_PLEWA|nr:hypothetical protein NDU88_010512 [Pleurodeles waltl]
MPSAATYWTNPQFKIKLDKPDDDHEGGSHEPCCTVVVGLMQKNRRKHRKIGKDVLAIGYALYQLENHTEGHLNHDFFKTNQAVAQFEPHINLREVSKRLKLPVGHYLIVPSTFEPFKDGDFCLRVFTEKKAKAM